ncbi:MAG: hypothetical protein JNK47_20900 [Mesorhizobium sp.]|nr:hypothetical protein [Mesorhizobium sp.]MBL8579672.1 hypothetical protein [Mesorhizobium sp.]
MSSIALPPADRKRWIAVLVARTRRKAVLSPFFAKSDGLLVIDPCSHAREFRQNPERTTEATRELILASGIGRLVCGFIAKPDRDALSARGIDIRIGSCARSIDALVRDFENLPSA